MTYSEDLAELAAALARLVAADAAACDGPSTAELDARDIVVERLAAMTCALTNSPTRGERFLARHVAVEPAHALHAALRDLQGLAHQSCQRIVEVLGADGGEYLALWQSAARAAVLLEPYTDAAARLPGPAAWRAVRDIAEIADAITVLDGDLTHRHPKHFVDAGRHGALRIAANELRSRAVDAVPPDLARPEPRSGAFRVAEVSDLPRATAHLARLVHERGVDLTAVEIRAVAQVLGQGAELSSRALSGVDPTHPALAHLATVERNLAPLGRIALATLTEASPEVRHLAGQIGYQFDVLGSVLDRVDGLPDEERRRGGYTAVLASVRRWTPNAVYAADALDAGLRATHTSGRLYAPTIDPSPGTPYRWSPVPFGGKGHRPSMLAAARSVRTAFAEVAQPGHSLAHLAADSTGQLPATVHLLGEAVARRRDRASRLPTHPASRVRRVGPPGARRAGRTDVDRAPRAGDR